MAQLVKTQVTYIYEENAQSSNPNQKQNKHKSFSFRLVVPKSCGHNYFFVKEKQWVEKIFPSKTFFWFVNLIFQNCRQTLPDPRDHTQQNQRTPEGTVPPDLNPINQMTGQSINQPINQAINQPII